MPILTGKTIGQLTTLTGVTQNTLFPVELSGNTYNIPYSSITQTFTGNTSATCITDLYVTNLNSCSPLHIQPTNVGDVYIGEGGGVNVGIGTSSPTFLLDVNGTINANTILVTNLNATSISGDGASLINIPTSAVTNLDSELLSLNNHILDTNNPHLTSLGNLFGGSAHTHTISEITNLQTILNNKIDATGGTITGSLTVQQNFTVLGTATTINTETLSIENNLITLNSNLTGATDQPFFGKSGIEILRGSATTTTLLWDETNDYWVAGLTGNTRQIVLSGDGLSLLNSGHTHPISEIIDLQTNLNNKFDKTGGTISGSVSATTISATTFYGDGSNLTGIITNGNYLPLSGGTVTGNTTFTTGVTINGELTVTGNTTLSSVTATTFTGDGSGLTNVTNPSSKLFSYYNFI